MLKTRLARPLASSSHFLRHHLRHLVSPARFVHSTPDLPGEADVVVVGGGSLGASALYHLQARGLTAVLVERNQLTSGTTWHSAGMLWRLRPNHTDIELHTYTRDMCKQLEEETGIVSWQENGGLFIANNEERFNEYKRLSEAGQFWGIDSRMLAPEDIHQVHPLLDTSDVVGALYSPSDGSIDPTGIVNAYSKAARTLGATVHEHTAVTGLELSPATIGGEEGSRITGVVTDKGLIKTKHVVNACGAWANELAGMAGVTIPLRAMKHAMVVTERLEGMHSGLPNVRDHDLSIYLKTQGDSMAIGGYERNPEFWTDVDPAFSFGLFELDYDTFGQNLEGHLARCPLIGEVGIKSTVCGPESFTPDHKPLVGPQRGVSGFWNLCGFNSMGMMLGGGMGREIATWITTGAPSLDMFGFDCNRFHPSTIKDRRWVQDTTHESYAKTYALVMPHDEPLAGRDARKSPIHDALRERGVIHQARHGFERPGWFIPGQSLPPLPYDYDGVYEEGAWRLGPELEEEVEGTGKHAEYPYLDHINGELTFGWPASHAVVAEECNAVRNGVGVFDQSYFGKFFLTGPDATRAVQWLSSANMAAKPVGSVTYTTMCNVRGGCEADLTITKLEDEQGALYYYFAAGGSTASKDFEWITRQIDEKAFNCALSDASETMAMISVQGPHSRALLQLLADAPEELAPEHLPFSHCRDVTIAGTKLMCLRLTFVGELGFELHCPAADSDAVYRAIRTRGEEYEEEHGVPVRDTGYRCIDSLSAEKGYRHWHADVASGDTPLEAAIGFTALAKLKMDDSDPNAQFLGRAALNAQRARGMQRKLVCLTVDDETIPLHGMETIWRDGECVGFVRSTAFGHSIGNSIAYGYVELAKVEEAPPKITNKWLQAGKWHVGVMGDKCPATVHVKAPFDPKNERVKGNYAQKR